MEKLSYTQIRDLCFDDSATRSADYTERECEWKVWRKKAEIDFGVTGRFFDLVKTLPGAQRYLQVKTYYQLSPDSATRVYTNTGYVEGVYTARAGYLEAQARNNPQMTSFFYSRLKEDEKNSLPPPLPSPPEKQGLYKILASGRVEELDAILHDYFTLPSGYSVARDVLEVPFWEEPPLYNIPLLEQVEDKEEIMQAVLVGLNPQVVDFFRSLFRGYTPAHASSSIYEGLLKHGRAEQAYALALRFPQDRGYDYMVEMLINPKLNSLQAETFLSALDTNLGNVALLTALLPYIRRDKLQTYYEALDEEFPLLHPLPYLILESYLSQA